MPLLNPELLKALDIAEMAGNSIAQAIVEDFVIFELVPKAMKYGTEIAIEVVKAVPKTVEATGALLEGEAEMIRAPGESLGAAAKGLTALAPFAK